MKRPARVDMDSAWMMCRVDVGSGADDGGTADRVLSVMAWLHQ